jgi:hypothetical protein
MGSARKGEKGGERGSKSRGGGSGRKKGQKSQKPRKVRIGPKVTNSRKRGKNGENQDSPKKPDFRKRGPKPGIPKKGSGPEFGPKTVIFGVLARFWAWAKKRVFDQIFDFWPDFREFPEPYSTLRIPRIPEKIGIPSIPENHSLKKGNFSPVLGFFGPEKTQNGFSKKRVFDLFSGLFGRIGEKIVDFAQKSRKKGPFLGTSDLQTCFLTVQKRDFFKSQKSYIKPIEFFSRFL